MAINPSVIEDFSLKSNNTFAISAKAKYFAQAKSVVCLKNLISSYPHLPKFFLGAGSNVLFTQDFPGLIIKIAISGISYLYEQEDNVFLEAGAGEPWENLIDYAIQHQLYGIENLTLIPGTVGGACVQNIGAYSAEFQEVVEWVKLYDIAENVEKILTKQECQFGYRESIFKHSPSFAIVSVGMRLNKKPCFRLQYPGIKEEMQKRGVSTPALLDVVEVIRNIRNSKLPDTKKLGNAGSFFKNPKIPLKQYEELRQSYPLVPGFPEGDNQVKVPAGWLIEQCGWKGKRRGNCGVYEKQALILVNYGEAQGNEILLLAKEIQSSVQSKFHISLETEVVIL